VGFGDADGGVAVADDDADGVLEVGESRGAEAAGWGEGPQEVGGVGDDGMPACGGVALGEGLGEMGDFGFDFGGVEEGGLAAGGVFVPVEFGAEGGDALDEVGVGKGEGDADVAAHAVAEDVGGLDVQVGEEVADVLGEVVYAEGAGLQGCVAVSLEVEEVEVVGVFEEGDEGRELRACA